MPRCGRRPVCAALLGASSLLWGGCHAQLSSVCDFSDISIMLGLLSDECCPDAGTGASCDAVPDTCSSECAGVLVPLLDRCGSELDDMIGGSTAAELHTLGATCQESDAALVDSCFDDDAAWPDMPAGAWCLIEHVQSLEAGAGESGGPALLPAETEARISQLEVSNGQMLATVQQLLIAPPSPPSPGGDGALALQVQQQGELLQQQGELLQQHVSLIEQMSASIVALQAQSTAGNGDGPHRRCEDAPEDEGCTCSVCAATGGIRNGGGNGGAAAATGCQDTLEAANPGLCASMVDSCATMFAPDAPDSNFAGGCDLTCGYCSPSPAAATAPPPVSASDNDFVDYVIGSLIFAAFCFIYSGACKGLVKKSPQTVVEEEDDEDTKEEEMTEEDKVWAAVDAADGIVKNPLDTSDTSQKVKKKSKSKNKNKNKNKLES